MAAAPRLNRLLRLEPWWLLLLSPLLLFPGRFLPPAWQWLPVVATLLFWPVRWLATGSVTRRSPLRLPVLALLLCLPAAIWVAADPARAWEVAGYLLFGVAVANALVCAPAVDARPQAIVWGLLALALGLSLVGPLIITETPLAVAYLAPLQRAAGPLTGRLGETINPNILANALLVALPFALALALRGAWTTRRWLPPLLALCAIWLAAILLLTESRGAWIALLIVVPLLVFLRWPRMWWLLPLLLAAAALILYRWGPQILESLTSGTAVNGFQERVEIWQRALFALHDFPFTGIGLGMFSQVVPLLYPYILVPSTVSIPDAHNLPLQVGVDLGLPGLVAWLAIVICQATMLVIVLRRRPSPLTWALAAGALASTVGALTAGLFSATNWGVKPAFLPWLVVALAVILHDHAAGVRVDSEGEHAPD